MYVGLRLDPYRIVRIVAFFVAGVVLAIGCASIYSLTRNSPKIANRRTGLALKPPLSVRQPVASSPAESASTKTARADKAEFLVLGSGTPRVAPEAASSEIRDSGKAQIDDRGTEISEDAQQIPAAVPASSVAEPLSAPAAELNVPAGTTGSVPNAVPGDATPAAAASSETARNTIRTPIHTPHVVTLGVGTVLMVRLSGTLSSDHNYAGDAFRGTLEAPVIANGFVIAEKGAVVTGRLLFVREHHFMTGSELSLTLTGIHTTDGQFVSIETSPWEEKNRRGGWVDGARHAVDSAAGVMLEAVADVGKAAKLGASSKEDSQRAGASNRKEILLPRGSMLEFRLANPVTLAERIW